MSNPEININQGGTGNTQNNTFNYTQIIQEAKRAGSLINLPQTNVTFFVGRDDDLVKVHELLQKNQRVAVSAFVKGMGGVGKSELALQYALRHLLTNYSGGICWLSGNEGTLPTQLQDFVQVQLGEKIPDGLDSGEKLAGHCWRRLSERVEGQMLVVLDDVKDYENVEPFLPPLDGKFRVLATTRLGLGNAMQQYTLDVLVLATAVDLLKSFLPETDSRRGNAVEIEKLCEWLGRLPLAIELVGRYLALPNQLDTGIPKILQRLQGECMVQLSQITDEERKLLPKNLNVAASFFLSWQELSPLAQRLACLLGLFALAPIPWTLVQSANETKQKQSFGQGLQGIFQKKVVALTEQDLQGARGELLNLHLLERKQQGVYELHQLLREYFQFQLQQHPKWQSLRQQVAVSLLNISKGIEPVITTDRVKEVSPAIPHLDILGCELLDDIPNPEEDLVWAFTGVARFYESQGIYKLAEDPLQRCLISARNKFGDFHLSVFGSLNNLASIYKLQGRYEEAEPLLQKALTMGQKLLGVRHPNSILALNNLASLYRSQGRYEEAESLYKQALVMMQKSLDDRHPLIIPILNNLALLYASQRKYEEAEPLLKKALDLRQELLGDSHPDVVLSLNNLADVYRSLSKYEEAEPLFHKAMILGKEMLGDHHPLVATILNNLAQLYRSQEKYGTAELLFQQTLALRKELLGDCHPDFAQSLNNLADVYALQGKYKLAEPLFQKALQIVEHVLGVDHPDMHFYLENYKLCLKNKKSKSRSSKNKGFG